MKGKGNIIHYVISIRTTNNVPLSKYQFDIIEFEKDCITLSQTIVSANKETLYAHIKIK